MPISSEQAILKVLKEAKEPLTPYMISKLSRVHLQGTIACLYRMSSEGKVEHEDKIIKRRDCTVWRLKR